MVQRAPHRHGVLTLPNAVTVVRLCAVPVFVWLLVREGRAGWWQAATLLAVLGATDWVDGFLARRLGQVSALGKVLDPVADRLLLGVAALSIVAVGAVPVAVAVAALAREALVASGFVVVAVAGGRRTDVSFVGKAGTFALMFALPLFLFGHSTLSWAQAPEDAAWVFAIPGLALAWYAAATYVPGARKAIAEGRAAKEAGARDPEPAAGEQAASRGPAAGAGAPVATSVVPMRPTPGHTGAGGPEAEVVAE